MELVDTDVLIDVQRGHPPAVAWFSALTVLPAVAGIVVMDGEKRHKPISFCGSQIPLNRVPPAEWLMTAFVFWPVARPHDWLSILNTPPGDAERAEVKQHIERSSPTGTDAWVKATAHALGLQQTLNPRGRPLGWRKVKPPAKPG
jgi:hypothetical protein